MEQPDLFLNETNPEAVEAHLRAKTVIAVLGGEVFAHDAECIGKAIAERGFSTRTGGFATGAMQSALAGAIEHAPSSIETGIRPIVEGVVTPHDMYPQTPHPTQLEGVTISVATDPYDRLRQLIHDSDIVVIGDGALGTWAEIAAVIGIELGRDIAINKISNKRIIFVGSGVQAQIENLPGIKNYISDAVSPNVHFISTVDEVDELVEVLFTKGLREEKRQQLARE